MAKHLRRMGVGLACLLMIPSTGADEPAKPPTLREQLDALIEEFKTANAEWQRRSAGVGPEDPLWIKNHEEMPIWKFAPRFLAFAEANPEAPESVDALLEIVRLQRLRHSDREFLPLNTRSIDILISKHLEDERVVQVCLAQANFGGPTIDSYFRALLAKSHDRDLLGRACMALVACNRRRLSMASRPMFDSPRDLTEAAASSAYMRRRLDPEYVKYVRTADDAALSAESEALLERVINEFSDIPAAPRWARTKDVGKSLGDVARPMLTALRDLAVGKVAPEIEGKDIEGKPMRLSDYRGKVVVLVFWGMWCPPCQGMIPHEKELVERYKDRPFALLGVNSDRGREKLKADITEKGITWRSWWDGGSPGGPIASRWDVQSWPSIFVLDERGVMRFKRLPHSVPTQLDDAVESVFREMTP